MGVQAAGRPASRPPAACGRHVEPAGGRAANGAGRASAGDGRRWRAPQLNLATTVIAKFS